MLPLTAPPGIPGGPSPASNPYAPASAMMGGGPSLGAPPGVAQVGDAISKLGAEIDQALKLLLQAAPDQGPTIAQMIMTLREVVANASTGSGLGLVPDAGAIPDGSSRLSGL